jgi:hypothetical protein
MTIRIINNHPTLKLRDHGDGWCEDASRHPGEGPRFYNNELLRIYSGTFRGGEFWGGEFWGGEFWGGEFWGGTFWGGEFRGGEFRGGTFQGGTFRGGITAQRSDGYIFTLNDNGAKIAAGCRYFTWAEARAHWGSPDCPRKALADETADILDFLEKQARRHFPKAFKQEDAA